jgi:hypothetical protein
MSTRRSLAVVGLVVAASTTLGAQRGTISRVESPKPTLRFVEAWRPASLETRVVGMVVDSSRLPVAFASVRLRDLGTGEVVQESQANDNGEYQFLLEDPGTYVVEMVSAMGFVVALSNAGLLARYQTLQTVVQLPGRWDSAERAMLLPEQSAARFLGASAATTLTAQTLTLAAQLNISPLDAGEPVSP